VTLTVDPAGDNRCSPGEPVFSADATPDPGYAKKLVTVALGPTPTRRATCAP
jgi:hypothetical protein